MSVSQEIYRDFLFMNLIMGIYVSKEETDYIAHLFSQKKTQGVKNNLYKFKI